MNDPEAIADILNTYKKHGWILRRVLLSRPAGAAAPELPGDQFSGAEIRDSDMDALWFSRVSRPNTEAWELRALSAAPFALLEVIPDDTSEADRETILSGVEDRMREMVIRGRTKDN
jgi:hypothetical protein